MGQIASTVGASSVLAALGLPDKSVAVAVGLLTLLASLASLFAGYRTRSLTEGSGGMQAIAQELMQLAYDSIILKEELMQQVKRNNVKVLPELIAKANDLCRTVLQRSIEFDGKFHIANLRPAST